MPVFLFLLGGDAFVALPVLESKFCDATIPGGAIDGVYVVGVDVVADAFDVVAVGQSELIFS